MESDNFSIYKYYKGEEKNPFTSGAHQELWELEKAYSNISQKDGFVDDCIEFYSMIGLRDFCKDDNTLAFKAFLFNRFGKYSSMPITELISKFKAYYIGNYK